MNDAIEILAQNDLVEQVVTLGCAPYDFFSATITARGRYEYERLQEQKKESNTKEEQSIKKPTSPIGSPFGFTDDDWETVSDRKSKPGELFVSFGHQFKSTFYDSKTLSTNINSMFLKAVDEYNKANTVAVELMFIPLGAGYGEHLLIKLLEILLDQILQFLKPLIKILM